jgi:hypothetical protein
VHSFTQEISTEELQQPRYALEIVPTFSHLKGKVQTPTLYTCDKSKAFWSGLMVHTCTVNTQEVDARGSGVREQPSLNRQKKKKKKPFCHQIRIYEPMRS